MDNSIENIWKEGFLQADALVAPKINDLYNQKSQHIVERFSRMYRKNRIAVLIGASIILLASLIFGSPITGILLFVMFVGLNYHSRQQALALAQINKGETSYYYLKEVKAVLEKILKGYERIYSWLYPAIILVFAWGVWEVNFLGFSFKETIISEVPDLQLILGLPLYGTLVLLVLAVLMGAFAGPLFRWEVNLIYGPVLNKLSELIADMEELGSQKEK